MEAVHHVGWASQPYVQFNCTGEQHYVSGGLSTKEDPLPEGVYRSDGGLYTFTSEKATCKECRLKILEGIPKYKACSSCVNARTEGDFDKASHCNICKGKGIVRNHASYACNACGGTLAATEDCTDKSPHGLIEARVDGGYSSDHLSDCTSYMFSICEKCLRGMFENFAIPPVVTDRLGDFSEGPESLYSIDSERYHHWLWVQAGNDKVAFAQGLCTERHNCGKPARWLVMDSPSHVEQSSACDDHVAWFLNRIGARCVPIESIPRRPSLKADFKVLKEAWNKAPEQFPSKRYTDEQMQLLCREMVGKDWEAWSKVPLPKTFSGGKTPEELCESYVSWLFTLIKVFAQRGEIPYFKSPGAS